MINPCPTRRVCDVQPFPRTTQSCVTHLQNYSSPTPSNLTSVKSSPKCFTCMHEIFNRSTSELYQFQVFSSVGFGKSSRFTGSCCSSMGLSFVVSLYNAISHIPKDIEPKRSCAYKTSGHEFVKYI